MDKQIIEISRDDFYLSLHRGFLLLKNDELHIERNIPLDNILAVVFSAHNATISKNLINAVCADGGTVIFCDKSYTPNAITIPYTNHWLMSSRIKQQLGCSVPLQKNLWKNIVQHKILNQAAILEHFFPDNQNVERLKRLAKDTLSNDSRNHEGQAANIYFKSLFGHKFIRDRLNNDINILLNYAYMVLRAMTARAIAGNGLLPYIGIKHCNKMNQLPLVDDIMEPFRAIADKIVFEELTKLVNIDHIELTPEIKRNLTTIISYPVDTNKGTLSLNDAIYGFVSGLVTSYETKKVNLQYPKILFD